MTKIEHVQADEKSIRLMQQIGFTIQQFTLVSPMTAQDIVGILAFSAGAAIANAPSEFTKGELRQMAIANIDHGLTAFLSQPKSSIIIPN